jgi:hypothetical protein
MPKTKTKTPPRTMPLQVRSTPEFLAELDALAADMTAAGHPIAIGLAEARGRPLVTRTDVVRLCIARGQKVLREEINRLREGGAP